MTIAFLLITMAALAVADHLTGTAWYQKGNTMFAPDHFDVWPDDELDELPTGLVAGDDSTIEFHILTDDELAGIDSEIDDWPEEYHVADADWHWFLSGGESEEYDAYDDADYRPDYIGGF